MKWSFQLSVGQLYFTQFSRRNWRWMRWEKKGITATLIGRCFGWNLCFSCFYVICCAGIEQNHKSATNYPKQHRLTQFLQKWICVTLQSQSLRNGSRSMLWADDNCKTLFLCPWTALLLLPRVVGMVTIYCNNTFHHSRLSFSVFLTPRQTILYLEWFLCDIIKKENEEAWFR